MSILGLMKERNIIYYLIYILITIMGLVWNKLFFGFLLFDIISKVPVLRFVVEALTTPWRSFIIILVFISVIELSLTIYAYNLFHEDFSYYCHSDLWVCYFTIWDWTWKVILILIILIFLV